MQNASSKMLVTTGRILLALYFLLPGLTKLVAPEMQLELMHRHHIPYAALLLPVAGVAQVLGSLLLLTNRHVRNVCFGFVLYIFIINFTMHDFWNFSDTEAAHELQNFIKNLGILAGLLVLAGVSQKRKLALKSFLRGDGTV